MPAEVASPVRVLMTADSVGGVLTYALELAGCFRDSGIATTLAVMGGELGPARRADCTGLSGIRIVESPFKLEWMEDPWDDVERAGEWLLDLEREIVPDIVHLNGFAHGSLPWKAPVLVTGHSCVLSWWRAVRGGSVPEGWDEYRKRVRAGLKAAHMVTAPSAAMLRSLEGDYGPFRRSACIHNGVRQAAFRPGRKSDLILTAGRLWDEAKNERALAVVAAMLPWRVFAAGEPAPDSAGTASGPIRYLGFLSRAELAQWYSRSAIYALPARYEPFGLTALEAGLSGCALVLGDIPSLREIWGRAALFVDPDDEDGLESVLMDLIEHPDLREEFSRRARQKALEYTVERTALRYLELYREIADGAWRACPSERAAHGAMTVEGS